MSFAQTKSTFQLSGNITDAASGEPILGVNILAKGKFVIGASSNADGDYNLKLAEDKYVVQFSHVAFRDTSIVINTKKWETSTKVLNLKMEFSPVLLNEAVAFGTPDTIYGHDEYNVGDLAFVDDNLLLMTYEKEDRWKRQADVDKCIHQGVRLVMLDSSGNVLDAHGVPFKCLDFYTDFFSEVLVSTMDSMLHVGFDGNELFLSGVSEDDYDNYYLPVIDSLHSKILASTYKEDYPGFEYYGFNTEDSTFKTLREVVDVELMEQFRSEYKWLSTRDKLNATRLEINTGIDKEIFGAYMTGFSNSPYYDALYAPLFVENDSVFVFDHYADFMFTYTQNYEKLDSVPISYHRGKMSRFWDEEVIFDQGNGNAYTVFRRNGNCYLQGIDKKSGESLGNFKMYHRYPQNLVIKNGEVYYIYRPFESPQKKFLYREDIFLKAIAIR